MKTNIEKLQIGDLCRQGDVGIRKISAIPKGERRTQKDGCLAYGEVTGHAHRVSDSTTAELFHVGEGMYLVAGEEGVKILHEEHSTISLPPGNYEIVRQREYSPEAIRNVAD